MEIFRWKGDESIYIKMHEGEQVEAHFRTMEGQDEYNELYDEADFEVEYGDPLEDTQVVMSLLLESQTVERLI